MRTVGIDLASQSAGTAACTVSWSDSKAHIVAVEEGVEDARLRELLADPGCEWIGLDVPLGWPDLFVEAVGRHRVGAPWPASGPRELTHRATDRWLIDTLRIHPLSVSTDRIAYPAMRAAALTSGLPRDGSHRLVEVYPAAALNVWRLPYRRYKRAGGRDVLATLVDDLRGRAAWIVSDESTWNTLRASDHAFDALIAALIARVHARGLCHPIPHHHRDAAAREGWICVPAAGLAQLPR
jgi:hypothetical protein